MQSDNYNRTKLIESKNYSESHPADGNHKRQIVEDYNEQGQLIKTCSYFNSDPDGIWVTCCDDKDHEVCYSHQTYLISIEYC